VSLLKNNHLTITKKHPQLQNDIYNVLKQMRAKGQSMNDPLAQPIIQRIIRHKEPKLLMDVWLSRTSRVILRWTHLFLRIHLSWSYKTSNTTP
jgi:hypothetical protein